MNSTNDNHNDDEVGSDNNSDASTSSSRAERSRRERTQRHRERLQRVKQFQQASTNNVQSAPQQHQSPTVNQQVDSKESARNNSESSSGSNPLPTATRHMVQQTAANTRQFAQPQRMQQQAQLGQPKTAQKIQQLAQQRKESIAKKTTMSVSVTNAQESARSSKQISVIPPPPTPPKHPSINPSLSSTSSISHNHHPHSPSPQQPIKSGPVLVSVESPLPPLVQRSLGDRSYEKRKNAALEIEQLVKSLSEANNLPMISSIISVLAKDFCTSMNANYRKGGLIGIAAAAIGLMGNTRQHLEGLLFPVLHCFDDPESRVRYYACESLYNIAKVARGNVLRYFNPIFDGLTKLFADVDVDVKNGANLLDRLIKDIVTESETG